MKRKLPSSLVLCLGLLASEKAVADVNAQEGSLNLRKTEMLTASPSERLLWERSYASRSEARGLLGLGWCTEFEWRLSFAEGQAWLQKCDDVERVPSERVQKKGDRVLIKEGGHRLIFSPQGDLEGFETKSSATWLLQRDLMKRPTGLLSPKGKLAVLKLDSQGRLERIQAGSAKWEFRYAGNLLSETRSETGGGENYEYDDAANLTRVLADGKAKLTASYDLSKDVVESVDEAGCLAKYVYTSESGADFVNDQVLETRTCNGRSPRLTENLFRYEKLPGNRARLLERTSRMNGE